MRMLEYVVAHKKELLKKTSPIFISVLFLVFLLSQISISEISTAFNNISLFRILMGLIIYVFIHFLRALRFKILLSNKLRFNELFTIVCLHNFMNNILPARVGEFSYIYLVKKSKTNATVSETIASLLLVRIFDIIGISIIFLISVLFIKTQTNLYELKIVVSMLILIAIILLFYIVFFGENFVRLTAKATILLKIYNNRIVKFMQKKIKETIESLMVIKNTKILTTIVFISILINFSMFLIGYIIIYGLGIHIGILEIFVAGTVGFFITLLPIQGFLNFGTMEIGFVLGFSLFDIPKETTIAVGFSYHIILTVYLLILASIGYYMHTTKKVRIHKQ